MTDTAIVTRLPCVVRLADGRVFDGALPAERHRALQLGMLHGDSRGYVEIAAGPRPVGGKVQITSRNDPGFYLPGGGFGQPDWLERMLEFAGGHANRLDEGVEVFVGVTPRSERKGNKAFVHESQWLWVDVDQAEELPKLWAFLAEWPAHLVILTGGSGGAHAYWKLNRPLAATTVVPDTGETIEWIERANERIINHLGRWTEANGRQVFVGADRACFAAGTLILAERGLVPIEDIRVGDRVLTHRGRWRAVTDTMRRVADTIRVVGHGHPGITTTAEHPFFARDRVLKNARPTYEFSTATWTPASAMAGKWWATPTTVESVPMPPIGGRGLSLGDAAWWMIGRWLGDGTISASGTATSLEVVIHCGHHEAAQLGERLAAVGDLTWRSREKRTVTEFVAPHSGLVDWLVEHFGRGAGGKTVPAWVLTLPEAARRALLDGYVSADGCKIGNRRQVSTVSRRLALGVRLLAESLGHRAAMYLYDQPTDVIEGRRVNVRSQWHVRWKANAMRGYGIADGDHSWLRVRDVAPAGSGVEVFNFSVEEDETYVADGIVVHNCKDRSRVMRLAGTINHKTGEYARLIHADMALAPYDIATLVGHLPDMPDSKASGQRRSPARTVDHDDPYKRIPPAEYLQALCGIDVGQRRLVSCPSPQHTDSHPSCSVGRDAHEGFYCLAGETRVITRDGVKPIAELAGTVQRVLTTGGAWKDAPFRSFGVQALRRLVLSRNGVEKVIHATPEHRWFVKSDSKHRLTRELTTAALKPGHQLASAFPRLTPANSRMGLSPFGIARGITFGDGTRDRHGGSRALLYGEKDAALLRYFPLSKTYDHSAPGGVIVADLPGYFKELPSIEESPSYLYGWLAGYFAADGDVSRDTIALNSADRHVLEHVRAVCTRLGIGTFGIAAYERNGFATPGSRRGIYRLRFMGSALTPEFFLIAEHRARYEARHAAYERRGWIVKAVDESPRVEEVFCATVAGSHAFALEDNILTGNCHGCGVGGGIYDAASLSIGGPTGRLLRGESFRRARDVVREKFGGR